MKKFTRLWQLTMVLLLSSGVLFAQKSNEQINNLKDSKAALELKQQKEVSIQKLVQPMNISAVANEMSPAEVAQLKQQQLPASEKDPNWKPSSNTSPSEYLFDLHFQWPLSNPSVLSVGLETDGNYIYTCHWQDGNYYRYDMNGTYITTFLVAGTSLIRDMAYNPNNGHFYGAPATTTVWEMDFTPGAEALVSTITAPTACRAIGFDDVNNFLFGNNWSTNINIFNLAGVTQGNYPVGPFGASYYGFAFDNSGTTGVGPYIWGYAQVATSLEWLVQMTYPTCVETGTTFDVGTYFGDPVGAYIAGGLAITPPGTFPSVPPGEWTIFGIRQNYEFWGLELDAPNPCSAPVALTATNVTSSSLDFGWTETGTSTTWEYAYGVAPFGPPAGAGTSTTSNPVSIAGLSAATAYDFYVRADCGGGAFSGWTSATFTTAGDCEWYVIGYDSYGDGWNGGAVTMVLNGNTVLNWTGPATTGPETVYFPMVDASTLDIVWTLGSWDSEVTYEVYDNSDLLVFSDGPNPTGTTGLPGYCTTVLCFPVENIGVANGTGTQIDVTWDDPLAQNTYDIVWGLPGFDYNTGPFVGTAYDEVFPGAPYSYTLSGLSNQTLYDVAVRANCGANGTSIWRHLDFASASTPANDECANATAVTGPYPQTEVGTTWGATIDCPGVLDWEAVWYEVTLPYAINNFSVDYCGTAQQSTIGIVYYADCSDCNAYVIASSYSFYDCGDGWNIGQMQWNAVPGPTTVRFPVYTADVSASPYMDFTVTFDVVEVVVPANDNCANATAIGEVVDLPWSTTLATPDTYGSCMTSNNIWYNYTATMDGNLTVSLCGSLFDTKLAIFDNFDCGTMVQLACNDDYCGLQSQIDFGPVTTGTQLKIEVGGYGTASGDGILNVYVTPPLYDVTGTITYANPGLTPMDAVTVEIPTYGSDVTDGAGAYGPLYAPDGSYTMTSTTTKAHGGLNGLDVILVKRWIAGLHVFTPIQLIAGDVNLSGVPDGLDVIMMKRRIGSLTTPAWNAPDYIFYDPDFTIAGAPVVHDYQSLCSGDVNGSHIPETQLPDNDDCSNPVYIAGPYPVTGITGTTVYATGECPGFLDMASGSVWYAIDLPYALNDIVIDLYGDALLDNGWIVGTDVQCSCNSADYYYAVSWNFTPPSVTDLTWSQVPGPATFYYPVATGTYQEGFTFDVDVTEYVSSGYCDATTTYQDEYIGTVTCGTINNAGTGWTGGVSDYTAQSTSIAAGSSEPITVLNGGNLYTGDQVTCWVDWNADYTWTQVSNEEFILTGDGTGYSFTGAIAVPAGTPAGTYRMRVRMTWSSAPVPCGASSYGEVEDYSIVVP